MEAINNNKESKELFKFNRNQIILIVSLLIVVGGIGAIGGMQYQKSANKKVNSNGDVQVSGPGGGAFGNISASDRQKLQTDLQSASTPAERQAVFQKYGVTAPTGGRSGGGGFGGGVTGTIINADSTSITVKMSDGSTKTVYYSSTTTLNAEQKATASDLKSGSQVTVSGSSNSDGSVTARTIRVTQ